MIEEITGRQRIRPVITPREHIVRYIRYLPWLVISIAIMLVAAYIKLRYSIPIYNVSGKLLVSAQMLGGGNDKFDDIFSMQGNDKITDQIEIIKSRSMASRVIRSLGLQKQVYNKGKVLTSTIYDKDVPFNFEITTLADSSTGFSVLISILENGQFLVNKGTKKFFFNEEVNFQNNKFRITFNGKDWRQGFSSNEFIISWQPVENLAGNLSGSINIGRVNDFTNVLVLSCQTDNIKMGRDIVNQYIMEFQQASLEDKREIAARTLDFIEQQLDTVRYDLRAVEGNLQLYREKNRVFNPEKQTELFYSELSATNRIQAEQAVKVKVLDYMLNYISNQQNQYKIIPSMVGIEEPALLQQVTEFNKLQLERETALRTTPTGNPRILQLETTIERLRLGMIENLKNVRQTYLLAQENTLRKNQEFDRLITSMPSKQKQLIEVTRQQTILQELYSYLLQKKLETAIASASTISNIKVVEPAIGSGVLVSPNKKALYTMAFLLGLAIPAGIVFLREYLDDKVKSKHEVELATSVPVLGEIGHAKETAMLVVTHNNRNLLAEQFRIIRTNLQYILPKVEKPVLLITSSLSGEGKSFISTNLGSVLALSGKRTVILEFDIRKPKIMKGLGLNERKGITSYFVGSVQLQEIIYPVPEMENLFVIPCGPVPPNPSEMLLSERVDKLFRELRTQFDAIIIDSAPVGLVSDAVTLGRQADATVYIVRHNYTLKKQLQFIEEIYQQQKLPHLSIIINDIDTRSGYGGNYGYGAYGYGYGYGGKHDVGYFDAENGKFGQKKKRKTWFSRSEK